MPSRVKAVGFFLWTGWQRKSHLKILITQLLIGFLDV